MRSNTVVSHFWKWFVKHNKEYLKPPEAYSKKERNYMLNEFQVHLRAYSRWLYVHIWYNKNTGKGILTITAHGFARAFKKADYVVARAPVVENWSIHSLAQPVPLHYLEEPIFADVDIKLSNLWFSCKRSFPGSRLPVIVYVDYILPDEDDKVDEVVATIIQNLVGERSFRLDMEVVDIQQKCDARPGAKLHKLEELPSHIGEGRSTITIDSKGRMGGW